MKKFWIRIRWGRTAPKRTITRRFATREEFNAYVQGVEDCDGWAEYEVLDRNDWREDDRAQEAAA